MWKFPFFSVLAFASVFFFGCEVRDKSEKGRDELAVMEQEVPVPEQQASPQSPQKPPTPTPVPKPAPYPTPKAAEPEDAGHHPADEVDTVSGSDVESDAAEATDEPVVEEDWGGCGPMEECVIDNDCVPDDPDLIQLWTDYKCTDGMCVLTPITYTFKFEGSADDEDDYLRMWIRTSDGYWEQKDYKLPVVLPLEQLCQPLKKSNYAKGVGESLIYHQLLSVVSLDKNQNVYGWHSLFDKKVWINLTTISFEEVINVIAMSLGGSIGPSVGYIKNLGGNCTVFGLGPNEYFSY